MRSAYIIATYENNGFEIYNGNIEVVSNSLKIVGWGHIALYYGMFKIIKSNALASGSYLFRHKNHDKYDLGQYGYFNAYCDSPKTNNIQFYLNNHYVSSTNQYTLSSDILNKTIRFRFLTFVTIFNT